MTHHLFVFVSCWTVKDRLSEIHFLILHSLGYQKSSLCNDPCHNPKLSTLEIVMFIATGMSVLRISKQKNRKESDSRVEWGTISAF